MIQKHLSNRLSTYFRETSTDEDELREFESKYHQKSPIWHYACENFLYGMLNDARQCLEMETMAKLWFAIRNLHRQLDQLHREQLNDFTKKFVVYRGQGSNKEDFHHLNGNKGGLLSFNRFLSTSKLRRVSMGFIEQNLHRHSENVDVLFLMTIDLQKVFISSTTPFALIDRVSSIPSEQKILSSVHTVFRIENIQQMKEKNESMKFS